MTSVTGDCNERMIRWLRHNRIDFEKWDAVVAPSGLPYALSWWLDIVSPGWEALVEDDYRAVMPLTVKWKYGLKYVVLPKWVQQLGVFGEDAEDVHRFVRRIPYLMYDFNLNYLNRSQDGLTHINYVVDGNSVRDENTCRNVRLAAGLRISEISPDVFIAFWAKVNGERFGAKHGELLMNLINATCSHGMEMLLGAFDGDRLVSAVFAVKTATRLIDLAPVSDAEGRRLRAMFGILDYMIGHLDEGVLFDCEGSMLPGVARFYRGFGGVEQNYRRIWRLSFRKKF